MHVIFMLLLMIAVLPARAEWVRVSGNADLVTYIDTSTIKNNGQLRSFWAIQDMRQVGFGGVMSIRAFEEYDCAEARFKFLSVSAHSGPMAGGQTLLTDNLDDEWSYIPRGMNFSAIHRIVCGP